MSQFRRGQLPQLVVDQGQEFLRCLRIARIDRAENLRDRVHARHNNINACLTKFALNLNEPRAIVNYLGNEDRVVNAADYTVWRNLRGTDAELPNEEETIGSVTDEDYHVWKSHFGESLDSPAGAGSAFPQHASNSVPEPSSLVLLVVGAASLFAARRIRR
ncbi:MAG: PEP-CTERM sorting domain-containing protein [Pirellulales bacterium]